MFSEKFFKGKRYILTPLIAAALVLSFIGSIVFNSGTVSAADEITGGTEEPIPILTPTPTPTPVITIIQENSTIGVSFGGTVPTADNINKGSGYVQQPNFPGNIGNVSIPGASIIPPASGNTAAGSINMTPAATPVQERISGITRFETAETISKKSWANSDNVILANGTDFPDVLAGSTLAFLLDSPILLTWQDKLPEATLNEIQRLKAKKIYILGGTGAVSGEIENSLNKQYSVERIFGINRYETAVKIGSIVNKKYSSGTAIIATGLDYPDALSIAPYAAKNNYPILFAGGSELDIFTRQALKDWSIKNVIVVGGNEVVIPAIEKEINEMGISVTRIGESDRYLTSLAIAKYFDKSGSLGIAVATGEDFPDAMVGTVFAAKNNLSIILTGKNEIKNEILSYTLDLGINKKTIIIFGGTGVVSDAIFDKLKDILKQ